MPASSALRERRLNRRAALLLASFGALLAFLDVTIVNIAFPSIQKSFPRSSTSDLSWVLNAYNIVFAALLVAAGRLADVFGRRRAFAVGLVVFTLASAACATAPGVGALVAYRCVQAVGAALIVPSSLALVVDAFPGSRRAHAISVWSATAAFAAGIGPPLGGALVQLDSWRLAFLINVPLGVVALVASRRVLVESRAPGRRKAPDLVGAALLGGSMAALTLAIVQGPTWGWGSAGVIGGFVGAMALLAGFGWSSGRHPVPVLDPKLLRIPTFGVANLVTFVVGMGFYAYLLNNILWLHYVWGYSVLRAGLAVAPGAIVAAVVAAVFGTIADRFGHRVVAVPGAVIWTGAYVWYLTAVSVHPDFLGRWLPGQVLSGIGVGMTLPIVGSAALAAVPGARYATASAILSSTRQLGAVVGIAVLVVVIGAPTPATFATVLRHGWVLSIACFAVAAVAATALRRPPEHALADEAPPPAAAELEVQPPQQQVAPGDVARTSLLAGLPAAARRQLLDDDALITVEAKRWLFRAGEPTDALFVVRTGRLDVVGADGVIRDLGPGDVVGELGVLTGEPRSAGVRARRDSVLWRVTPQRLDDVLRRDREASRALTRVLAEQLRANQGPARNAQRHGAPRVVAVVGIGDGAPVDDVADRIERSLRAHMRVHVMRAGTAEALHRIEPSNDRVLLVAADARRRWHGFSLRQADRVVVVADASSTPPQGLSSHTANGYVVLTGSSPTREQLVGWHDALAPRYVAVAADGGVEVAADGVARRIAGRSVAVVIAGGGARALSAIGVVDELERAGFVIDRFGGASLGAIVAGGFALGYDATEVDARFYDELVRRNPFNDYRVPSVALLSGRKADAVLGRQFGDTLFEQLPRDLTVVSTDLIRRRLAVHRRGHVATAIRASISLPALFPPARIGDSLHVDGGILDNLPVAPVAEMDEGPVVAININNPARQMKPGAPPMPSIGETLLRTMLMGSWSRIDDARMQTAILVTPDTRGIGLLEFHQIDRALEAGRIAGAAVVPALQEWLRMHTATMAIPQQQVIDLTTHNGANGVVSHPRRRVERAR